MAAGCGEEKGKRGGRLGLFSSGACQRPTEKTQSYEINYRT